MTEWMITLDTPPGVAHDAEQLVAFSAELDQLRPETGAAASLARDTGALSATFTVPATSVQEAVERAVEIFDGALARIGLPHGSVAHVDGQPVEDTAPALA